MARRHLHLVPPPAGPAQTAVSAEHELDTLRVGEEVNDGFLAVRRTPDGFVVCDHEAVEPIERPASRAEALEFLVAIRGTRSPLALVS